MANDVKIRFRSFLPGAGKDSAGRPKQGKSRVVGEIDVTSYVQSGETLTAEDVGLNEIDFINLRVKDETGDPAGDKRRNAVYVQSQTVFYLNTTRTAGGTTSYASAATETVTFDAFGDSAHDVELL